jgi:hypothetical protein
MEGVDTEIVKELAKSTRHEITVILGKESAQFEVTKTLLNILHNLVRVGSIPADKRKRKFFDDHSNLVLDLLSTRRSLKYKKKALARNPLVVINIATSWPTVDL